VLAELDEALSCQYGITNANIHEGKNPYIKFKNTGFSLSTPTQEESEAEPLQQFCRFWRSWRPSIAIATGWTSYSTGSVTIMVVQLSRLAVRSTLAPIYFARPDALPACKSAPVKRSTFLSATNKLIASVNSC
jgi:hypothetical protein